MCRKCHLRIGFAPNDTHLSCAQEMCPTHQISCVREMCMKCHLSCFQIFSFMPESAYRKCKQNVLEMSCVLTTGNVPEISCVLVQEMCLKFCPTTKSQGNVKISWCRKCTRNVNFPGHFVAQEIQDFFQCLLFLIARFILIICITLTLCKTLLFWVLKVP